MKILEFFQSELNKFIENKTRVENDIRRAKLDLQALKDVETRILSESDNTFSLFYANNAESINSKELISLKNSERDLTKNISSLESELEYVSERIKLMQDMIMQVNQSENTYTNSSNSIKTYSQFSKIDILKIQEEERQRIARDIHDSVVQKLTVLYHKSEFAMKVMDTDPIRTKLEMEVINNIIKQCIDELREIILDLRPMSIDDLGLKITISGLIEQLKGSTQIDIQFEYLIDDDVIILPEISITIMRIIQELCSNAIKHSHGTSINISLSLSDNNIKIFFEDDGIGLDQLYHSDSCNTKTGFGLPILNERIHLLNGSIKVGKNKSNVGTCYQIMIPINSEEEKV